MKVTFACEKCGFVRGVVTTIPSRSRDETIREFMDDGLGECPNCAKLTYGPLTEEMVADALRQAAYGEPQPKWPPTHLATEFGRQARFVLRLLIDGDPANNKPTTAGCTAEDWRNWLLDLARQK